MAAAAARVHRDAVIVDTHADTPTEFFLEPGYDFGARHENGHIDLPRLREGGVGVQFLIAWVPAEKAELPGASFAHALELVDAIHRVIGRTAGARVVVDADGIAGARAAGDVAIMIGVEGGHAIENSIDNLRRLYARGVRYLTLTWNNHNDWADAAGPPPRHGGLTTFGRDVVREMNRLRMLVDVSHVAESTFYDALEVSAAPVIASHSCARALADHPRNLTDDQLRALARAGGVVGVNFFPTFLDARYGAAYARIDAERHAREARARAAHGDPDRARREAAAWLAARCAELPPVPITAVADHIQHIAATAGTDHVGLGSDFDGIPAVPDGLPDAAALPRLTELLLARGFDDDEVRKILGGNFLRVFRQVLG
ncbi:MAG TPA: dipeptidase [Longimicrobiales bacterium]